MNAAPMNSGQGNMQSTGSQTHSSAMTNQAQAGAGRLRGDAAERQETECLNNAAAQHQSLSTCHR